MTKEELLHKSELYKREYLRVVKDQPKYMLLPLTLYKMAQKDLRELGIEIEDLPLPEPIYSISKEK